MASPLLDREERRDTELALLPALANRHGLITGATGTGKTVTLQALAQRFSPIGVPVFMADVKGDLSGIAKAGGANPKVAERAEVAQARSRRSRPARWCSGTSSARAGHPVRATISDMGPLLLGRMLGLNETQEGVLGLVFKIADDDGLLLLDLKDLRAMLQHVGDNAAQFTTEYGNVSTRLDRRDPARPARAREPGRGAVLRRADARHRRPDADARDGKGVVNILAADKLMNSPKLYADLPAVAAVGAVRAPARGRRPRQAEAGVLLRRGAPAVHRGAEGAAREGRAGGAPDPLQGRRRLLRDAEPARRPRDACSASSATACSTRCAPSRRSDQKAVKTAAETLRAEPEAQGRAGDHRARRRRGAGVASSTRRARPCIVERAFIVPPGSQLGPITRRRAPADHQVLGRLRPLREGGRPRVGLREAEGPHRSEARRDAEAELEPGLATRSPTSCSARPGRAAASSRRASSRRWRRAPRAAIGSQLGRQIAARRTRLDPRRSKR